MAWQSAPDASAAETALKAYDCLTFSPLVCIALAKASFDMYNYVQLWLLTSEERAAVAAGAIAMCSSGC